MDPATASTAPHDLSEEGRRTSQTVTVTPPKETTNEMAAATPGMTGGAALYPQAPGQSSYTVKGDSLQDSRPRDDGSYNLRKRSDGQHVPGNYENSEYYDDETAIRHVLPLEDSSADDEETEDERSLNTIKRSGKRRVPTDAGYRSLSSAVRHAERKPSRPSAPKVHFGFDEGETEELQELHRHVWASPPRHGSPVTQPAVKRRPIPEIPPFRPKKNPPGPTKLRQNSAYAQPDPHNPKRVVIYNTDAEGNATEVGEVDHTTVDMLQGADEDTIKAMEDFWKTMLITLRELGNDLKTAQDEAALERQRTDRAEQNNTDLRQEFDAQVAGHRQEIEDLEQHIEVVEGDLAQAQENVSVADATVVRLQQELDTQKRQVYELKQGKLKYKKLYGETHQSLTDVTTKAIELKEQLREAKAAKDKKGKDKKRRKQRVLPHELQDSSDDDDGSSSSSSSEGNGRADRGGRPPRPPRRSHSPHRSPSYDNSQSGRAPYRAAKQPEPEVFGGSKGVSSQDYAQWKLNIKGWIDRYHRDYDTEAARLTYLRQKTKDNAWGVISHGYMVEGNEFQHSSEVWDILDSVYKPLNSAIEANAWMSDLTSARMKESESISEYIARFTVHTSALGWQDILKIQNLRNLVTKWWQDHTIHLTLTEGNWLMFCSTLRKMEQLRPKSAPSTGNRSGGGGGGGGNRNTTPAATGGGGGGSGRTSKLEAERDADPNGRSKVEKKVLYDMELCYRCFGKHRNSADAPCKDQSATPIAQNMAVKAAVDAAVQAIRSRRTKGAAIGVNSVATYELEGHQPAKN